VLVFFNILEKLKTGSIDLVYLYLYLYQYRFKYTNSMDITPNIAEIIQAYYEKLRDELDKANQIKVGEALIKIASIIQHNNNIVKKQVIDFVHSYIVKCQDSWADSFSRIIKLEPSEIIIRETCRSAAKKFDEYSNGWSNGWPDGCRKNAAFEEWESDVLAWLTEFLNFVGYDIRKHDENQGMYLLTKKSISDDINKAAAQTTPGTNEIDKTETDPVKLLAQKLIEHNRKIYTEQQAKLATEMAEREAKESARSISNEARKIEVLEFVTDFIMCVDYTKFRIMYGDYYFDIIWGYGEKSKSARYATETYVGSGVQWAADLEKWIGELAKLSGYFVERFPGQINISR